MLGVCFCPIIMPDKIGIMGYTHGIIQLIIAPPLSSGRYAGCILKTSPLNASRNGFLIIDNFYNSNECDLLRKRAKWVKCLN